MDSIIPDLEHRSLKGEVSAPEWRTRVEVAAGLRLAHKFGWNDGINNHISARLADSLDQFIINGRGLGWHEATASNLTKAGLDRQICGAPLFPVSRAGLNFHAAVLAALPEINCIVHVHPLEGIVISAMERGLMILDQAGCVFHDQVAYHPFDGYADDADEGRRIADELGDNFAMIMWNHGLLTVGRTVSEAFCYMRRLIEACRLQEHLLATGAPVRPVSDTALAKIKEQLRERRGNQPYGEPEWSMLLRVAKARDPSFEC
ncbi:MAG: class II aldolase/adducin family protein [Alphaproteobacteria bacterium]